MKNILIINGHQKYEGFAEGNLTKDYIHKDGMNLEDELSRFQDTLKRNFINL